VISWMLQPSMDLDDSEWVVDSPVWSRLPQQQPPAIPLSEAPESSDRFQVAFVIGSRIALRVAGGLPAVHSMN
jgi:hypothetical protein